MEVNFFGKGKPQQARPSAGARPDCILYGRNNQDALNIEVNC
jgi:hypothetical protein